MVRDAASGIQARQMKSYEIDTIKLVMLSFMLCFMIFPLITGNASYEAVMMDNPIIQNDIAADDNLLTIQLTASSDYIATGNVSTYRGFAYSDDNTDFLRFVDPINQITLNQSIESGTLEERTITGVDIDDDGSTEFLILNHNGTTYNLLVVDFNDAKTTTYNVSVNNPSGISIGEFNGDTNLDVAIFGRYGVIMLDIQTDQLLGNFTLPVGDIYTSATVGRFLEPSQDSIAIGIWPTTKIANLSIVAGNGTVMRSINLHNQIFGLAPFEYGSGLDEVAAMIFDGNLTAISPNTMSPIFNTTGLPERSYVLTGFLNHDNQQDLMVIPEMDNYTVYIDGTNGSIIRQSVVVSGSSTGPIGLDPPTALCDYGNIDADNLTDFALLTDVGNNPGFLRGSDGEIGFYEPTISSKPSQIRVYDVNKNSKDDIFVLQSQTVYVLLSDVQAPIITPEPLSPPHPTVHDPYIEIEVGVEDITTIILAEIFIRHEDGNWTQPVDELQNAGTQYFVFLVGLPEGYYDYYLVFQDTFLNVGTLGNQTHPMNFTVAGHLAWSDSKNQNSQLEHHMMDIGNTSDGSEVIYILDSTTDEIWLESYTPRGVNQTLGLVANRTFSDFWIYTGMMDGDNILDPIIVLYNATSLKINVSIYHGASGSFWFTSQYPVANFTAPNSPQVIDCDNDGIDEFFFVSEHRFEYYVKLIRLRSDGSWSDVNVTGSNAEFYGLSLASTVNSISVEACVSASTGPVDIFNATSMTLISTHNVTSNDHLFTIPAIPYAFNNASEPFTRFMLYMYFLDPTGYSAGFYVFGANTPRINETTMFTNTGSVYISLTLIDVENDGTDEIIASNAVTGDLTLIRLADPVIVDWSVPISNSEFLSSVIVDFDGDGQDEVGVFTKEDNMLRIVSLDGIIERSLTVGKGYGSMRLSNIDLGYGEEIVVYPLVQNGITKIGVIRDINLIRRLNASLTYSPSDLLQGNSLSVSVDVTNIYSEIISDAEVYLTIHYMSGSSIVNTTKSLIFDTSNYSTTVAVNWPIGIVNLSLIVNHILYDVWQDYYPNALTVRSALDVSVYTKDIVMQNSTFSANITVTDSLGARVPDASVTVSIDGTDYAAIFENTQYRLAIPNIDIIPGEYIVNASVDHLYAESTSSASALFRLETNELQIVSSMPALIEQDDEFAGWLNITDMYSNPIEGAHVVMTSGSSEFTLIEVEPGRYFLDSYATLNVGNHSFEISVEQEFLQGTNFGDVQIVVMGDLSPVVPIVPPVDGGDLFNVTVFLNDIFGTTPSDSWVTIEIDGRNVTAVQVSGGRFIAELNATYAIGEWTFTVHYGSEFSHTGKRVCDLVVYSNPLTTVTPSDDWSVGQANTTIIEVQVDDWLNTAIQDASVTLFVRGTTYTLEHVIEGLYQTEISTVGWPYGVHAFYLTVDHEYMYQEQIQGNLTVIAKPTIIFRPSSVAPVQFSTLVISVEVADLYDNPVTDLQLTISFDGLPKLAEETSVRGTYSATFDVGSTRHGEKNITVHLEGDFSITWDDDMKIYVEVYIPSLDSLGTIELSFAAGLSLLLSLIGMILFVKVSSVISTKPRVIDDVTKSVSQLDRIYIVIVALSGLTLLHSWLLFSDGAYAYALVEILILLGTSVLLYGIWLYRDAYSSILLTGSISRRRVALGIWHLFLVPFMVLLIFFYGNSLELFQRWILEIPQIVVGEFQIAPLLATVLVTYMSSIVVVVVSFYREIRKGLNRIDDMQEAGTPKNIIDEEQALLIGRTGSSIRIKFLMFLLILGATTIMQLEFLKNYSMAAIILIPVVFLLLIPFISSRLVKGVPALLKRSQGPPEEGHGMEDDTFAS